jgi:hypothetical protein
LKRRKSFRWYLLAGLLLVGGFLSLDSWVGADSYVPNITNRINRWAAQQVFQGGVDCDSNQPVAFVAENDVPSPISVSPAFFWADSGTRQPSIALEAHAASASFDPVFAFRSSAGATHSAASAITTGTKLGTMVFQGYDGVGTVDDSTATGPWANGAAGGVASLECVAEENFNSTHHGTSCKFYTTSLATAGALVNPMIWNSNGTVGINTGLLAGAIGNPAAVLHAYAGSGNEIVRLQSNTTGDNPMRHVIINKVTTTDATVTTLHSYTCSAGHAYFFEFRVAAQQCTGANCVTTQNAASYRGRMAGRCTSAATATLVGTFILDATDTFEDAALATATITFDATGSTFRIQVTGVAATTVLWMDTLTIDEVGPT